MSTLRSHSPPNLLSAVVPHLIDWSNAGGKTALHAASQSGNLGLVRVSGSEFCTLASDLFLPGAYERCTLRIG